MSLGSDYLSDYAYEIDQGINYYEQMSIRAERGLWLSREGELKISEMRTTHIENCLNYIEGTELEDIYKPVFLDELNRRIDNQIKNGELDLEWAIPFSERS